METNGRKRMGGYWGGVLGRQEIYEKARPI
jgi:hypothetical protein